MAPQSVPTGSPVTYPSITIGGKQYQLRFAHSAWYLLSSWGYEINAQIPIVVLAAAAAGEVGPDGRWKSAGFARPIDLTDAMIEGESLAALAEPVLEALKKAAPKASVETVTADPSAPDTPIN